MSDRVQTLEELLDGAVAACVVLASPEAAADPALLARLAPMGVEPVVVEHPLLAFARAALFDRMNATRAAWGLEASRRALLVIDTEEDPEDLPRLTRAVSRSLPSVAVVRHRRGETSSWEILVAGAKPRDAATEDPGGDAPAPDTASAADRSGTTGVEASPPSPNLRLVSSGGTSAASAGADADDEGDAPEEDTVSREELAMLLQRSEDADQGEGRDEGRGEKQNKEGGS